MDELGGELPLPRHRHIQVRDRAWGGGGYTRSSIVRARDRSRRGSHRRKPLALARRIAEAGAEVMGVTLAEALDLFGHHFIPFICQKGGAWAPMRRRVLSGQASRWPRAAGVPLCLGALVAHNARAWLRDVHAALRHAGFCTGESAQVHVSPARPGRGGNQLPAVCHTSRAQPGASPGAGPRPCPPPTP